LSSATDHNGSPVKAVVSEHVFSFDHHLILPEGSRLEGVVTQALPARRLGRNGQLRFMFRQIELAPGAPRRVEASLQGVDAASDAHLELDAEGGAHAITPKTRYIAPAIDVLLATSSLDGLEPHHHHLGVEGGARQGGDVAGGAVRGGAGFGLVGSVIGLLAHYRPINAGFAFYGAGWSVYTHVAARGSDVVFPKNTPMEIRFGTHADPTPPAAKPEAIPAVPAIRRGVRKGKWPGKSKQTAGRGSKVGPLDRRGHGAFQESGVGSPVGWLAVSGESVQEGRKVL
jgi:hypothetical protein